MHDNALNVSKTRRNDLLSGKSWYAAIVSQSLRSVHFKSYVRTVLLTLLIRSAYFGLRRQSKRVAQSTTTGRPNHPITSNRWAHIGPRSLLSAAHWLIEYGDINNKQHERVIKFGVWKSCTSRIHNSRVQRFVMKLSKAVSSYFSSIYHSNFHTSFRKKTRRVWNIQTINKGQTRRRRRGVYE